MFKQLQTALFGRKVKGNELMYYISLLSSSLKNPYAFNAKIVHKNTDARLMWRQNISGYFINFNSNKS